MPNNELTNFRQDIRRVTDDAALARVDQSSVINIRGRGLNIMPCAVVDPTAFGIQTGASLISCVPLLAPNDPNMNTLVLAQNYSGTYQVGDIVFVMVKDGSKPTIIASGGSGSVNVSAFTLNIYVGTVGPGS
jgi:hypothetical protein